MARKTFTVMVDFDTEEAAAEWFSQARSLELLPTDCGLRRADALDRGGRALPGDLVAKREPGPGGWVVEP